MSGAGLYRGNYLRGKSLVGNCSGGGFHRGQLSGGSCPGGNESKFVRGAKIRGELSWGEFRRGNCPGGNCPGGKCPDTGTIRVSIARAVQVGDMYSPGKAPKTIFENNSTILR